MAVDFAIGEDILRVLLLSGAAGVLAWRGRTHALKERPGWRLILGGLLLLGISGAVDVLDELPAYATLPAALNAEPWGAFELLTQVLGPGIGTILLLAGFLRWLPLSARLSRAEADLRQANAQLHGRVQATQRSWQTLLSNAPDYILVIDRDLRVQHANRTPAGLTVEQVLGQDILAFVPAPIEKAALELALRQATSGGEPTVLDLQGAGPNGTLSPYRCRIMGSTDSDGQPVALMLNADRSQQVKAEQALRTTEDRYRKVLRSTKDLFWDHDLATDCIQLSGALHPYFDVAGSEVETDAASWTTLMHPDDRVVLASFEIARRDGHATWHGEYRLRRLDGGWTPILDRCAFLRDEAGKALRAIGSVVDLTDVKAAEQALRDSERQYRELVEGMEGGFWSFDAVHQRMLVLSSGLADLYAMPLADLKRNPFAFLDRVHPEDRPLVDSLIQRLSQGERVQVRYRIQTPDGSVRWLRNTSTPHKDAAGRIVRIEGFLHDVTAEIEAEAAQERAQRLQESTEFKTQFLNMAAHELATPITPLKLQLATLKLGAAGAMTPAQLQAVGVLERNVTRLGTLVTDLLDAARLQAGHLRLTKRPLALRQVVADTVASFASKAREDGITLLSTVDQDLEIEADGSRLAQVLTNLVHNALKFTPRGGEVALSARRSGEDAEILVRDNGLGMDGPQLSRLFQPFVQVHDTLRVQVGGTGLGLYICRGIVEQHGGSILACSDGPGHGSTFAVRLPLRAQARATPVAAISAPSRA